MPVQTGGVKRFTPRRENTLAREHLVRRLTAIFAADVAGYSRLTGMDEEGTHVRLKEHLRVLINPKVAAYRGHIVKNTGDGFLAEFNSVVDAMRCAVDVQRGMAERNSDVPPSNRIEFRIGINVGDIIEDNGDIFGDGVNIAARLEAIAEPGGICVSDDAHRQLRDKLDIVFDDAGEQNLKNIERPVRVFRVMDRVAAARQRPTLALPDKPSIAVLPFQNLSADPEQEYFADGVVEDITMALSRFRWLFVIARNSSFTYKGRAVDVKQVGRELGCATYSKVACARPETVFVSRVSLSMPKPEHISGPTGLMVRSRYVRSTGPCDFQRRGCNRPQAAAEEIKRARRKPTENLDAYDYYLRGLAKVRRWTKDVNREALQLFCKAIELDLVWPALWHGRVVLRAAQGAGWMTEPVQESAEATRLARKAVHLGGDDPIALCMGGYALAFVAHEFDDAAAFMDRGLRST